MATPAPDPPGPLMAMPETAPDPAYAAACANAGPELEQAATPQIGFPSVEDVHDLDWDVIRAAVDPAGVRSRMRAIVEAMETLLDSRAGAELLFDAHRATPDDRAILVPALDAAAPLWIVGDLHGDLLTLEAALALVAAREASSDSPSRLIFLGDFFDDEGFGLETLLRVFELILTRPGQVCIVAGNHDEALSFDGARFTSSVSPGDFADFLNANLAHEWIVRAGKVAVRLIAQAPRAIFLPDGLLVAHAGFPLSDLHQRLAETGDWNDPQCLSDFVWSRAHPTARRKMPNRYTRGSQFGYEDFAAFCEVSARLGRPVTHMVRGHDHVEERYVAYPAYQAHPILTTIALSRRLPRESFGPVARVPTVARYSAGMLPQVHRLHIPAAIVQDVFPQDEPDQDRSAPAAEPGA